MNWDYFTFFIMGVILLLVIFLIFFFGDLPGKIARQRNHPQADAINVLSWIGLAAGGIGWVVALVWAYTHPVGITVRPDLSRIDPSNADTETLRSEIARLQGVLGTFETALSNSEQAEKAADGTSAKKGHAS